MKKRGKLMETVLTILSDGPQEMEDLIAAFLISGYGASLRTIERNMRERSIKRELSKDGRYKTAKERQHLYALLSKLKKDGFIRKDEKQYSATAKGLNKLREISGFLPDKAKYEYNEEKILKIVAFDIPEKLRAKRKWVREILQELDFKMLQKSVWVGTKAIPEEFIKDLRKFELAEHIEIFAITRTGTLRSLK